MTLYPQLILDALVHVRYPGTGKDIVSSGMVQNNIHIDGNKVTFSLIFEKQNDPFAKSVVKAAEQAILTYVGEDIDIKGNIGVEMKEAPKPKPVRVLPGVKNIIAVFREKGAWENQRFHRIWLFHWPRLVIKSVCSMPIYMGHRCPKCSAWKMPVR